jgi:hypothetical protein
MVAPIPWLPTLAWPVSDFGSFLYACHPRLVNGYGWRRSRQGRKSTRHPDRPPRPPASRLRGSPPVSTRSGAAAEDEPGRTPARVVAGAVGVPLGGRPTAVRDPVRSPRHRGIRAVRWPGAAGAGGHPARYFARLQTSVYGFPMPVCVYLSPSSLTLNLNDCPMFSAVLSLAYLTVSVYSSPSIVQVPP